MNKTKMPKFKDNNCDLTEYCPWVIMADEGVVLIKDGLLSTVFEFIAPDVDSASASIIYSLGNIFNTAIMQLGERWAVQFELQKTETKEYPGSTFDNIAGYIVERQREQNFVFEKAHFVNRYYFTLTYELPNEIEQKGINFFYKKENFNIDEQFLSRDVKEFKQEAAKIKGILSRYMKITQLDSEELLTYLHTSVSLNWNKMKLPEEYTLFLDRVITAEDIETSNPMKLGDNYIPIIGIKAFPSTTLPVMFDALNKANLPLRWSTRFITYSRETAIKKIDKAEKQFHSRRKSLGQQVMEATMKIETNRENSGAFAQEIDASEARVDSTMGAIGFGDYTSSVMVWDENLKNAEEKAKYLIGIIGSCGFSVAQENHNAYKAFCGMMPGNIGANKRKLFVSTGNLSQVIPLSSVWAGLKNNNFLNAISGNSTPHVICSTNASVPFFLNLNVGDVGHHWVSGPTGAGKSTYLSLLEIQWLKYPGAQVIIFDKDLSSRCTTMCVGGKYIEPGKDDISFQPLAHIDTDEEKIWASEFIECLLQEQNVPITALMQKQIFETIEILAERDDKDLRKLSSFETYCNYQNPVTGLNDIVDGIAPYLSGGQYGKIFDQVSEDISFTEWTMFEMGTLMNMGTKAVTPSLIYLFNQCEKMFTGKPTLLVLDEAWIFLKNEIFSRKIAEWLKVLRKKNVFVVFATQEIDDASKSPIASTIISQCASKVYLADEQATTPMMAEAYRLFGLEDSEIRLLQNSIKKQDYYYKSALGSRQFQLELDKVQLGILTNSAEDHVLLTEIENDFGKNTGESLAQTILAAKGISFKF